MADFDPTQYGATAVEEPPPFDPTAHGAIPVNQEEPGVLQKAGRAIVQAVGKMIPTSLPSAEEIVQQAAAPPPLQTAIQGTQLAREAYGALQKPFGSQEQFNVAADIGLAVAPLLIPALPKAFRGIKPRLAEIAEPLIGRKEPATPMEAAVEPVPATPEVAQPPLPSTVAAGEKLGSQFEDLQTQAADLQERINDQRVAQPVPEAVAPITYEPIQETPQLEVQPTTPEEVTPSASEPSTTQMETGETPQRIETRPTSEVPSPSDSDYAQREAQGAAARREIPRTETRTGTEAGAETAQNVVVPEAVQPGEFGKSGYTAVDTPAETVGTGISNQRLTEAYGDSAPVATTGKGPGAWKDEGLSRLDNFQKTGDVKNDPYTVLTNLREGRVPMSQVPSDVSLLRSEHQRLLEDARQSEGTPEYAAKSQAALDMATAIKGVAHGPASDVFRALQEYDKPRYDNITDFDQALRERENRESTTQEKTKFKKMADDVASTRNGAEKEINGAQKRLSKLPRMSFEEAAKSIHDQITELTKDCVL